MQAAHRPGPLKQQNKSHKRGRHRSNRELQTANKGKVDIKTLTKKQHDLMGRDARRNQVLQLRKNKRQETFASKRSIGSDTTPPILVMVYSKSGSAAIKPFFHLVKTCSEDAVVTGDENRPNSFHLAIPKFKLRYHFLCVPEDDLFSVMDGAKVSDILIMIHSIVTDEEELKKDSVLNAIYSHFLPTTVHVVHGMEDVPVKKRADLKKNIQKAIESKFPDEKLHMVDKTSDALQFLHQIGNCKRRKTTYKKYRPQILAEAIESQDSLDNPELCKLMVTGYVRNQRLDANRLIHIPGFGDFQMELIEGVDDPHPLNNKVRKIKGGMDCDDSKVIQKADPMKQESLETENPLDPMEGEQNFPTAEEIAAAAAEADEEKRQRKLKKVTKGTSEYQAAWILDDDEDGDNQEEDDESDSDDDQMEDVEPHDDDQLSSGEESTATLKTAGDDNMSEVMTVNEDDDEKYDQKIDEDEEKDTLAKHKQVRIQEMFPDEIDTPHDVPAKVRFARYRGLKSFSYSSWDSKENLPSDYSRIFQFQNFERTRRRVVKEIEKDDDEEKAGAEPGSYVRVHISNVPKSLAENFKRNPDKPLLLTGLLQHEQKMSVLNFVIKKHAEYEGLPIGSKERLIFHVGCRRFYCNPVFSAHTNGDKFKYEKFLRDDDAVVASVYAPITFPPASVVVFKEQPSGAHKLVATGSLLSVSPDRMVIKRIVLSGHPFKINKRHAVIRYMFFNKDDILWFKPVELRTKYGRKGHIKEPLGTHGHMKCVFDRPLTSMDTVLMHLYKRVYPKWTFDPYVADPKTIDDDDYFEDQEMKEDLKELKNLSVLFK